jgi:hypothetical protein
MNVMHREFLRIFFLMVLMYVECDCWIVINTNDLGKDGATFRVNIRITVKNTQATGNPEVSNRCDNWFRDKTRFVSNYDELLNYGYDRPGQGNYGVNIYRFINAFQDEKSALYYEDLKKTPSLEYKQEPHYMISMKFFPIEGCFEEQCYFENWCWYPRPSNILSKQIRSGLYLVTYPQYFILLDEIFVTSLPETKKCDPGYWLTCKNVSTCQYNYPIDVDIWETVKDSTANYAPKNIDSNWPTGHCYPCNASYSTDHYVYNNNPPCSSDVNPDNIRCKQQIYDFGLVNRVYCPGGDSPPLICATGSIASDDKTKCVCDNGKYYDIDLRLCKDCPLAHYCTDNIMRNCPIDTYQSSIGQTKCLPCTGSDGTSLSSCSNGYLPGKCSPSNGLQFQIQPTCVPCKQCRNSIIDMELGNSVWDRASSVAYYYCYEN